MTQVMIVISVFHHMTVFHCQNEAVHGFEYCFLSPEHINLHVFEPCGLHRNEDCDYRIMDATAQYRIMMY